jgi:urease accessory protein
VQLASLCVAHYEWWPDFEHDSTGLGPVYDGLLHFLLSPEDPLPVLALALLAGQRGAHYGRRVLLCSSPTLI